MEMIHWSDWKGGEGQKTKKVSANNNQPDDQHGGEVGLHDGDASDATARERHTWWATIDAVRRDSASDVVHVSRHVDRTASIVRRAVKPVVRRARRSMRGATTRTYQPAPLWRRGGPRCSLGT